MNEVRKEIIGNRALLPNINMLIEDEFNVDDFVLDIVIKLGDKPPEWEVDPFQLEDNFEDVGRLLERMLDLRRDIWDLSATIQKTALQYISAVEQVDVDNALQIANSDDSVRQKVEEAARLRAASTRRLVGLLESRHGQPGNALNYKERLNKMKDVLAKDVESCYVRSIAVNSEAGRRYYLDLPMPFAGNDQNFLYVDFDGAAFLDDWSAWHRKLARDLELKQAAEQVHEVVISLGRHQLAERDRIDWDEWFDDARIMEKSIVLTNDFANAVKAFGGMSVDLSQAESFDDVHGHTHGPTIVSRLVPSRCGQARIVAIQMVVETSNESREMHWRFNVAVRAPMTTKSVVITASSVASPSNWFVSPVFAHRPADGQWHFEILSAVAENSSEDNSKRQSWPITDVKLYLRLSGV